MAFWIKICEIVTSIMDVLSRVLKVAKEHCHSKQVKTVFQQINEDFAHRL